jgi:hypothetical protein
MKKQILSEEFKRMQKLAGLISENQMSLPLNTITTADFKKLLNSIPAEKYFNVLEDLFDSEYVKDVNSNPYYLPGKYDSYNDGDFVDYLYDPIFNNELKGKPGINGNNFNEWQKSVRNSNPRLEFMLVRKIERIIDAYKDINDI